MISLWLVVSLLTCALSRRHRNFVHISGEDGECSTPHNVEGECVPLRQCEPVMSLLRGGMTQQKMVYIRRSMCKFTGVACDNYSIVTTCVQAPPRMCVVQRRRCLSPGQAGPPGPPGHSAPPGVAGAWPGGGDHARAGTAGGRTGTRGHNSGPAMNRPVVSQHTDLMSS